MSVDGGISQPAPVRNHEDRDGGGTPDHPVASIDETKQRQRIDKVMDFRAGRQNQSRSGPNRSAIGDPQRASKPRPGRKKYNGG